jgi:predicted small secreted protein
MFVMLFVVGAGLSLSACNTVRGVGTDLQSVANEVDDAT